MPKESSGGLSEKELKELKAKAKELGIKTMGEHLEDKNWDKKIAAAKSREEDKEWRKRIDDAQRKIAAADNPEGIEPAD